MKKKYTRHEISEAWGDQSSDAFSALIVGLNDQGFDPSQPVLALPDGRIWDGWHRYKAATSTGIDPIIEVRDVTDQEILQITTSRHRGRRNLSPSEMASAVIRAQRAAGYEYAGDEGGRPPARSEVIESSKEPLPPPPVDLITSTGVSEASGVSKGTALRAIRKAKRAERGEEITADDLDASKDPFAPDGDSKPSIFERPPKPQNDWMREANQLKEELKEAREARELFEQEAQDRQADNEVLSERIAIMAAETTPDENQRITERQKDKDLIRTLKSQVSSWMGKHSLAVRETKALRRQVKQLQAELDKYKQKGTTDA